MKGFVHVLEIILCALMVMIVLTQFSSLYLKQSSWPKNYLSMASRDMVYTASFLGDDWQNSSFIQASMDKILFSSNIEYESGLKNAVKRNMIVGCFCTADEMPLLKTQLDSFELNGRDMTFKVLDMAGVQDWNSLDVIVYAHYQNMDTDRVKIMPFLEKDRGMILAAPLTQAIIAGDATLREVFGIKWITNLRPPSTNAVFIPTSPWNESYNAMKYFYGFRASDYTNPLNSEDALGGPVSCTNSTHEGRIKTRGAEKKFWIIDSSEKSPGRTYCDYAVYVDSNGNGEADPLEGPLAVGDVFSLNGYEMKLKDIQTQAYNELVEAEAGVGWSPATPGLCTGEGDDLCSEGEGVQTAARNQVVNIGVKIARPDKYEIWVRSYRSSAPNEDERGYYVRVDGGTEIYVDPYVQRDEDFRGLWGWNKVGPEGSTVYLDKAGPHTITLRSPTGSEKPGWESSAVDWIFLRNTTFNAKNSIDENFFRDYKFVDFSLAGPYPDNDKIERIAVGSEAKYTGLNSPVAAAITKNGATAGKMGRAVWLASNAEGGDFKNLVRSAIIWSAKKEFTAVSNPSLGSSSTQSYTVLEQGDMNNPYQIFVTLWYSRRPD